MLSDLRQCLLPSSLDILISSVNIPSHDELLCQLATAILVLFSIDSVPQRRQRGGLTASLDVDKVTSLPPCY